ncbi:phosphoserine aminotransferase 2, chloroplastic-like [Vigna unguiculata]|uniref:Phosphoserine aminotransferase n=1 Tax=Vigna unguiculata TaxID=3917 RepID=A0A4D6KZG1_VIGUN|nr:phosphoserine aminotransferase 2, chloroplastic-like [Vigna unguiculata]XP_027916360.1 phosphoserine aminotransferase 2, chloroplastic-like [Vigna unguiculata]QCD82145.1 phosphoserine aminotransferase [Vigna unguiculata]
MSISTSPHSHLLHPNHNHRIHTATTTTAFSLPSSRTFRPIKCASTPAQLQDPIPVQAQAQERVFNFAAGPATLPETVLRRAQSELYLWGESGMSVMEMSHRGKDFMFIIEKAEEHLRTLLEIPPGFSVLFLQGGATTQFAAVPLNLCTPDDPVDYVVTGSWSDKAFKEAQKYCKPSVIWSGKSGKYTGIPHVGTFEQNPDAKYLHICANETIHGVEYKDYPFPENPSGVLVADMSSNFCSKPVDVSRFGVIYAGAQKNVGPSGVTIVIVRDDLIGRAQGVTPVMLDYKIHVENGSLYNTPPCYGIYMCGLVFEELLEQGGLKEVEKKNEKKAEILYNAIDGSKGFYKCPVEKPVRSLMNVPFTLEKSELEGEFIKEAAKENMVQLKGHRSVGGMRASIYNAMPLAGIQKLVAFMEDFQARHD